MERPNGWRRRLFGGVRTQEGLVTFCTSSIMLISVSLVQVLVSVFSDVFSFDGTVWGSLVCSELQNYFQVAWPVSRSTATLSPHPLSFALRSSVNPLVGRARSSSSATESNQPAFAAVSGRRRGNSASDLQIPDISQPSMTVIFSLFFPPCFFYSFFFAD